MPKQIIESKGKFHVRYTARNGKIIAWTENYESRRAAEESIGILRGILNAPDADQAASEPTSEPAKEGS